MFRCTLSAHGRISQKACLVRATSMRNVNLSSFSGCSLIGERLEEIRVLIRDILPRVQIPEVLSTAPNCNPVIAGLSGWRSGSVGGLLRAKRPSVRTTIRDISHIISYQERDNMHQNTGRDHAGNSIRLIEVTVYDVIPCTKPTLTILCH